MKSITFNTLGVAPPEKTPLVESEHAAVPQRCDVKSPKSCALPADAIVTKSITFVFVEVSGQS